MAIAPTAAPISGEASESIMRPALIEVQRSCNWTTQTRWLWPEGETGLNVCWSQVEKLDPLIEKMPGKRVAIQAGGAVGIYPAFLARHFAQVYTFEPNPSLWRCLVHNTAEHYNVSISNLALGLQGGTGNLVCPAGYKDNRGAWFVQAGTGGVAMIALDSLGLEYVDLIMLDVEGMERDVLRGAKDTIARCRPLIVVEDKQKCRGHHGVPDGWLDAECAVMGYRRIGYVGSDELLVPE